MNKNVRLAVLLRGRVLACLRFKTQTGMVGVAVAMPEDSQLGMVDDKIKSSWRYRLDILFVCYLLLLFLRMDVL